VDGYRHRRPLMRRSAHLVHQLSAELEARTAEAVAALHREQAEDERKHGEAQN
jgi:hypothetical protein